MFIISNALSDLDPSDSMEKQLKIKWWYQNYTCLDTENVNN